MNEGEWVKCTNHCERTTGYDSLPVELYVKLHACVPGGLGACRMRQAHGEAELLGHGRSSMVYLARGAVMVRSFFKTIAVAQGGSGFSL